MFDLEREVSAWSQAVHAGRCNPAASAAELSDHLYCEIDRARAGGMTEEQAFRAAVAALGSVPALAAEHAKNRSLLRTGCAVAARLGGSPPSGERRGILVAHALIWAALILGTSLLLSKSSTKDAFSLLLITILLPCWFASEQILRRALRSSPAAGA